NPCHIEISKSGKVVIVANYSGGGTTAISIATDGSFSGLARAHSHDKFYKEQGKFRQQNQPRAHNVCMSPDGRYVFISDLGLDKIIVYKFDDKFEKLSTNKPAYIKTTFGAGPRHFTFHPNGKFAYGINELNSSISFYLYEGQGKLNLKQDISTKPKNWTEANNCADIHVHPNGKFLYGSNRGNNSIAIFSINQQDGTLKLIGHESTRGNWPRNFAISPSGNHLLVANKKSHDIFTFKIDNKTGTLTYTGNKLELLHPICIKFINK
ncbi:MAG: lactonase family protein, partial [Lentisphaeraceae bacterium]|nr:lactonase family protein [Lentisphaeraceae bacterium]